MDQSYGPLIYIHMRHIIRIIKVSHSFPIVTGRRDKNSVSINGPEIFHHKLVANNGPTGLIPAKFLNYEF
jgi:hypothetical protein